MPTTPASRCTSSQRLTGSLGTRLLILAASLLLSLLVLAIGQQVIGGYWSYSLFSAFLFGLCVAIGAHILGEYPQGDELMLKRMATTLAVRTAAVLCLSRWGANAIGKDFVYYLLFFYLIGLFVDVWLHTHRLQTTILNKQYAKVQ